MPMGDEKSMEKTFGKCVHKCWVLIFFANTNNHILYPTTHVNKKHYSHCNGKSDTCLNERINYGWLEETACTSLWQNKKTKDVQNKLTLAVNYSKERRSGRKKYKNSEQRLLWKMQTGNHSSHNSAFHNACKC